MFSVNDFIRNQMNEFILKQGTCGFDIIPYTWVHNMLKMRQVQRWPKDPSAELSRGAGIWAKTFILCVESCTETVKVVLYILLAC